jgi:hypothetical protein
MVTQVWATVVPTLMTKSKKWPVMMNVRTKVLTCLKRQPVLTASAEEPISKRKCTNIDTTSNGDLLDDVTPRATRGKTSNTSGNVTNKKVAVKPPKPSLCAVQALQVTKTEVS